MPRRTGTCHHYRGGGEEGNGRPERIRPAMGASEKGQRRVLVGVASRLSRAPEGRNARCADEDGLSGAPDTGRPPRRRPEHRSRAREGRLLYLGEDETEAKAVGR
ncbi:hypothetical protein MRX96_028139 [Rhipicephalus microplus]